MKKIKQQTKPEISRHKHHWSDTQQQAPWSACLAAKETNKKKEWRGFCSVLIPWDWRQEHNLCWSSGKAGIFSSAKLDDHPLKHFSHLVSVFQNVGKLYSSKKINVSAEQLRTVLAPWSLKREQNRENGFLKSSRQLFFSISIAYITAVIMTFTRHFLEY